jgi:hypothetical protein
MPLWIFLDEAGRELGRSEPFVGLDVAEAWMAGEWHGLLEQGVEEVVLVDEDGGTVYRMSLGEGPPSNG